MASHTPNQALIILHVIHVPWTCSTIRLIVPKPSPPVSLFHGFFLKKRRLVSQPQKSASTDIDAVCRRSNRIVRQRHPLSEGGNSSFTLRRRQYRHHCIFRLQRILQSRAGRKFKNVFPGAHGAQGRASFLIEGDPPHKVSHSFLSRCRKRADEWQ